MKNDPWAHNSNPRTNRILAYTRRTAELMGSPGNVRISASANASGKLIRSTPICVTRNSSALARYIVKGPNTARFMAGNSATKYRAPSVMWLRVTKPISAGGFRDTQPHHTGRPVFGGTVTSHESGRIRPLDDIPGQCRRVSRHAYWRASDQFAAGIGAGADPDIARAAHEFGGSSCICQYPVCPGIAVMGPGIVLHARLRRARRSRHRLVSSSFSGLDGCCNMGRRLGAGVVSSGS